jgi:hypothetical protein
LIPQSEIERMTHTVLRDYTPDDYQKSTPAEKQILWQLENPRKAPRTEPTKHDFGTTSVASTSTSSTGKHSVDESSTKQEEPTEDSGWHSRNHHNAALVVKNAPVKRTTRLADNSLLRSPLPLRLLRPFELFV